MNSTLSTKIIKDLYAGNTEAASENISSLLQDKDSLNDYIDGFPLLAHAVRLNNGYIASQLLEYGADLNIPISKTDNKTIYNYAKDMATYGGREPLAYESIVSFIKPMPLPLPELKLKDISKSKDEYTKYYEQIKNTKPNDDVKLYHGLKSNNLDSVLNILNSEHKGVSQISGPTLSLTPLGQFWNASPGNETVPIKGLGICYTLKRKDICFPGENNPNAIVKMCNAVTNDNAALITNATGALSLAEHRGEVLCMRGWELEESKFQYTTEDKVDFYKRQPAEPEFEDIIKMKQVAEKLQNLQNNISNPSIKQKEEFSFSM